MSSLRDSLSAGGLRNLIASQIQPGAVFVILDPIAKKEKFIVILGVDAGKIWVGTLFINSEKNVNFIKTLEQHGLQFIIKASNYEFLDYDSFINASNIIRRQFEKLVDIIIARDGRYLTQIIPKDFDYIRARMADSKVVSTADKKDFGLI